MVHVADTALLHNADKSIATEAMIINEEKVIEGERKKKGVRNVLININKSLKKILTVYNFRNKKICKLALLYGHHCMAWRIEIRWRVIFQKKHKEMNQRKVQILAALTGGITRSNKEIALITWIHFSIVRRELGHLVVQKKVLLDSNGMGFFIPIQSTRTHSLFKLNRDI